MLKTYYCVTSRFFDDGSVTVAITTNAKEASCPRASFASTPTCDVYHDWFGSYAEALRFVKVTKTMYGNPTGSSGRRRRT